MNIIIKFYFIRQYLHYSNTNSSIFLFFVIFFVSLPTVRGEIRTMKAFAYSKNVLEVWPQIDVKDE